MNRTLEYYNKHANTFFDGTISADLKNTQDKFLSLLPSKGLILDFGCGSGRDTLYFLQKGFQVDAIDGSKELCILASKLTGLPVQQMLFQELEESDRYDGVWACSSILHISKDNLQDVFSRMIRATKKGGYIYMSFKYGDFEGYRNERFFTDFTENGFREYARIFPEITILETWISEDVRPGRSDEKWLNIILRKSGTT